MGQAPPYIPAVNKICVNLRNPFSVAVSLLLRRMNLRLPLRFLCFFVAISSASIFYLIGVNPCKSVSNFFVAKS